jgi:CBS domain containing-hemolysin-like protein
MYEAMGWLALNLLSIIMLSFYSMMEMACVSFNRVRLHYYVSKGEKRALWLNYLLHHPSRLFGTTLIGVNVAMIFGSEFAREFHSAIGVNPDLAPLSQVIIVVIFGELAPMFAARGYPEHIAMMGIPLLYASAKIMKPILWGIGAISHLCNMLIGNKEKEGSIYLTQDELQKILEEQEGDQPYASHKQEFNAVSANIFSLRKKDASQVMTPLNHIPSIPSNSTVESTRKLFSKKNIDYLPIYHNDTRQIIGIAFPRDLIRVSDIKRVRDYAHAPWFISQHTKITQILKQFRHNNQEVAVILDKEGNAVGILDLDDIIEEIFEKSSESASHHYTPKRKMQLIIDRTFPGDLKVSDFNAQFNVLLQTDVDMTFSELMTDALGHDPEVGESIYIDPFELTVKETTLRGIKSITITTSTL